jgi:hypothetical protein
MMNAGVTQLVESLPSKQVVAGSSPVSRSTKLGYNLPRPSVSPRREVRIKMSWQVLLGFS